MRTLCHYFITYQFICFVIVYILDLHLIDILYFLFAIFPTLYCICCTTISLLSYLILNPKRNTHDCRVDAEGAAVIGTFCRAHLLVTAWRSFISDLSNQTWGHDLTMDLWRTPIRPPWIWPTCGVQSNDVAASKHVERETPTHLSMILTMA